MKIKHQKRLAGQILKCSKNKIKYDLSRIDDIKEAITKNCCGGARLELI